MIRFDPSKRPSAVQALQHPFFSGEKMTITKSRLRTAREQRPQLLVLDKLRALHEAEKIQVRPAEPRPAITPRAQTRIAQRPKLTIQDPQIDDVFFGMF
jgi:hypothetical protein